MDVGFLLCRTFPELKFADRTDSDKPAGVAKTLLFTPTPLRQNRSAHRNISHPSRLVPTCTKLRRILDHSVVPARIAMVSPSGQDLRIVRAKLKMVFSDAAGPLAALTSILR